MGETIHILEINNDPSMAWWMTDIDLYLKGGIYRQALRIHGVYPRNCSENLKRKECFSSPYLDYDEQFLLQKVIRNIRQPRRARNFDEKLDDQYFPFTCLMGR